MSKQYTIANVNIGEIVYFQETWSGNIIKGTISQICEDGCRINCISHVDRDGKQIAKSYGEGGARFKDMFSTAKLAYEIVEKKENELIQKYCEEIKTLEDLINFPLSHCISGEEYTNWEARKAYELRAKELYFDCNFYDTKNTSSIPTMMTR